MTPHRNGRPAVALAADLIAVVAFAATGRRSHAEGLTVAGVAQTAWPFLAGTLVGLVALPGDGAAPAAGTMISAPRMQHARRTRRRVMVVIRGS